MNALSFLLLVAPAYMLAASDSEVSRVKRGGSFLETILGLTGGGGSSSHFGGGSSRSSGSSFGRNSRCSENRKSYATYCNSASLSRHVLDSRCDTRCHTFENRGLNLQLTFAGCNGRACECRYCDKRSSSNSQSTGHTHNHGRGGSSSSSSSYRWGAQISRNEPGGASRCAGRDVWTDRIRQECRDTSGTRALQMRTCQEDCRSAAGNQRRDSQLTKATCTTSGECECSFCEYSGNGGGSTSWNNRGGGSTNRGSGNGGGYWGSNGGGSRSRGSNNWGSRGGGSGSRRDGNSGSRGGNGGSSWGSRGGNGGSSWGSWSRGSSSNRGGSWDRNSRSGSSRSRSSSNRGGCDVIEIDIGACTSRCENRCRARLRDHFEQADCNRSHRCICMECDDHHHG